MITKENLSKDLQKLRVKLGKIPSGLEYTKYGEHGKNTVIRKFGSWSEALKETFHDYKVPCKSQIVQCGYCEKSISVQPYKMKNKNYCSVSCSNKDKPRRKKKPNPKCSTCNNPAKTRKGKYCDDCLGNLQEKFLNKTLGEFREERKDATRYSQIREHARKIMKQSNIEKKCHCCSYDKHVHVAHLKDIKDFPNEATVREINTLENLKYLCPNCHWEFDHNLLQL